MKRRIAAIAFAVLAITAAPPAAHAPALPPPGWDWSALEALLRAATDGEPDSLFADHAPLRMETTRNVAPEPTAAVLAALGLAALAVGRRRSRSAQ